MANVHTLSDLNNGGGGGGGYPGGGGGGGYMPMGMPMGGRQPGGQPPPQLDPEAKDALSMFAGFSGGGGQQTKAPRQENFWDMWKFTFCSNFYPTAVPALMWYAITLMYILSLCLSPKYDSVLAPSGLNYYVFLGPNLKLLEEWGCKDQQ